MGYIITTQMMAAALETDSVAKMAAIVGTPDNPVSLRRLFKDFRIKARPRPPADLEDTGPDYMYITWIDPGAGHFWRATAYNAKLSREGYWSPKPPSTHRTASWLLAKNRKQATPTFATSRHSTSSAPV